MDTVAEVALATPVGENSLYHYQVPAELADGVCVGTLVHVPFGPRELQGVVFEPDAQPIQAQPLKAIRAVLDRVPVVTPAGIALARWVSAYYSCPLAEVLAALQPAPRRCGWPSGRAKSRRDAWARRAVPPSRC